MYIQTHTHTYSGYYDSPTTVRAHNPRPKSRLGDFFLQFLLPRVCPTKVPIYYYFAFYIVKTSP